ncbi:Uncharacterised protein [Cedecea neteri]|uniref:Uncharacterized protein n=1 Tax=Cedecea neteri TaxID=158822 RepID=A0A2X3KZE0_9ENTR|nr:Uncharacterised protein [Cedecea neteri]
MGAIGLAGKKLAIRIPEETAVDANVSLGKVDNDSHFALEVTLNVKLPGLAKPSGTRCWPPPTRLAPIRGNFR